MTAHDKEVLERLGFKIRWYSDGKDHAKGYGEYGANGFLTVHDDGTFNLSCFSNVFDEICKDISKLRKEGVVK